MFKLFLSSRFWGIFKKNFKDNATIIYVILAVLTGFFYALGISSWKTNPLANTYVAIIIIIYLAVSVALLLFNKFVMTYSDKIIFYSKSFSIILISFGIVIVALSPLHKNPIAKDIIVNVFTNFKFLFSASLILDVFIQGIKIWKFRKDIVAIDELVSYKYIINSAGNLKMLTIKIDKIQVENIIKSMFPSYDYLSKNKKKAVDPATVKRIQDIYLSLNYDSIIKESDFYRMKNKLDFLTSETIHIQFDASVNYGKQTVNNNKNANFQVVNIDLFTKYLQSINSQGKRSTDEKNALYIIDSYVNELVKLNIEQFDFQELLVSEIEYVLNHTKDSKLITPESFSEIGLKKQGTWLAWVGNLPMS